MKAIPVILLPGDPPLPYILERIELTEFKTHRELMRAAIDGWVPDLPVLKDFGLSRENARIMITSLSPEGLLWMTILPRCPEKYRAPAPRPRLSEDQYAVLELLAKNWTTARIARELNRSRRWVMYRVEEIKALFDSANRNELLFGHYNEIKSLLSERKKHKGDAAKD